VKNLFPEPSIVGAARTLPLNSISTSPHLKGVIHSPFAHPGLSSFLQGFRSWYLTEVQQELEKAK
jgi:hypothetical protein